MLRNIVRFAYNIKTIYIYIYQYIRLKWLKAKIRDQDGFTQAKRAV